MCTEVFGDDGVDIGGECCAGVAYCADDVEEFAMVFRGDVNPMVCVETFGSEEGGVIVLFCHSLIGFMCSRTGSTIVPTAIWP